MKHLLMLSGSIACAKATGLISEWVKRGDEVQVMASASALKFVGEATLEGLSQKPVMTDTFESGNVMAHIHISRWADEIVLCPATANTINKLSAGIADDLLTSTWVAAFGLKKPMTIVPAMNSMMWQYPATQASIEKLKNWGVKIVAPQQGALACGELGDGRMAEVNDILAYLEQNK